MKQIEALFCFFVLQYWTFKNVFLDCTQFRLTQLQRLKAAFHDYTVRTPILSQCINLALAVHILPLSCTSSSIPLLPCESSAPHLFVLS